MIAGLCHNNRKEKVRENEVLSQNEIILKQSQRLCSPLNIIA